MRRTNWLTAGAAVCVAAAVAPLALAAQRPDHHRSVQRAHSTHSDRHVLLISVDGLHQSDLAKWVGANPDSTLAQLLAHGTNYANAAATFPSDSFPGMLGIASGGTPKTTGVYYDDSYDRSYYPPSDTSCSGPQGTEMVYAEPADKNPDALNGGVSSHQAASIDPSQLPRQKTAAGCDPVLPYQLSRANTIFTVIHRAGLRTAWSDKHPAYAMLDGGAPNAIDDLFTPEINSKADPGTPGPAGGDWTSSEPRVQQYDSNKVKAVVDEINGQSSYCVDEPANCSSPGTPTILGMNFQSVSVGQKLPNAGSPTAPDGKPDIGGYAPDGSFNPNMQSAMQFVDTSLGQMVSALKARGLARRTEMIITAKHGQAPVDPNKLHRANPDDFNSVVSSTTGGQFAASGLNQQVSTVTDDVGLIWLSKPFQPKSGDMISAFNQPSNRQAFDIAKVISGNDLRSTFGDPATDPRVPDAVVQPNLGGLYSESSQKVAEHGGGTADDRHVALIVTSAAGKGAGRRVGQDVTTTQVAPTILRYLGLDPRLLDAVRAEGTRSLPRGEGPGGHHGGGHGHGGNGPGGSGPGGLGRGGSGHGGSGHGGSGPGGHGHRHGGNGGHGGGGNGHSGSGGGRAHGGGGHGQGGDGHAQGEDRSGRGHSSRNHHV